VGSVVFWAGLALAGLMAAAPALPLEDPLVVTQVAPGPGATGVAGVLRGGIGEGARLVLVRPDGAVQVLSRGFHSAADPDVSFDGARLLFAGKRSATDPWDVYELDIGSGDNRRITHDLGDCRNPRYLSRIYTIDSAEPWPLIAFESDAAGEINEFGGGRATSLYSCRLDGSEVRRLTYNPSSELDPFLMDDGRILFASWQRSTLARGILGRVSLFAINSDGTDVAVFAADEGDRVKQMPCATPGGLAVFVESDRVPWDGAGQLAAVSLRRPLHSYRRLTDEAAFLFHSPSPLPDGSLLVSRRPAGDEGTAAVHRMDPATGHLTPVFDDPDRHDYQARLLHPRPRPDGRSSVVTDRDPNGKLYCLNAYASDLGPSGWAAPGTIDRVRVIEGVPRTGEEAAASSSEPALVPRRLLGEVPVESDGSFNLEVPANVPIQLQVLDADGMALRTCDWIWVRNHESRGCIGCHEDGELTPENRFMEALKKPSVPLTSPAKERRTIDFRRDVWPVLEAKCASGACHGPAGTYPLLEGAESAYTNLVEGIHGGPAGSPLGRYIHPGRARTSSLVWHMYGRDTSRPWDARGGARVIPGMPRLTGGEILTPDERRIIVEWIDLGAPWDAPAPGSGE